MRVAICGGTGFIGQALTTYWLTLGHEVIIVTRSIPEWDTRLEDNVRLSYVTWDDMNHDPARFERLDALVNLAGASLSQRWTEKRKEQIMASRKKTVAAVAKLMHHLEQKPPVVVQASAMAIYGTSEDEVFTEQSPAIVMDFPSKVVEQWEQAAESIETDRLIKLRISVVLGTEGGALPKMLLPYKLGVGGPIGSGQQWLSWIHIDDIVRLIDYGIHHEQIHGAVNAASPHAVRNDEFGRIVSKVYRRPHWFPLPAFALRTTVGQMSMILLKGQHIVPDKALHHGFSFTYPTLTAALTELKNR